ncbi:MAG: imidazole glycerol-phosphate synthase subunit HisH [Candidatus Atribacteria bacterium]|nr:imidazole glycerol-phosphate synthase subunit HisH [Candidatus Atribacteria bacterium]
MIAIVNYGIGNLFSVAQALKKLGEEVVVTNDPSVIEQAEAIILPGVGSFGEAMKNLEENQLIPAIVNGANQKKPILGICLGLQILFSQSQEATQQSGLSLIPGEVRKLPPTNKVPHIGWNQVSILEESPLGEGIASGEFFYFAHSYYVVPEKEENVVAICNYNVVIPAMIKQGKIAGVQFHPEKSSTGGIQFLKNWQRWIRE